MNEHIIAQTAQTIGQSRALSLLLACAALMTLVSQPQRSATQFAGTAGIMALFTVIAAFSEWRATRAATKDSWTLTTELGKQVTEYRNGVLLLHSLLPPLALAPAVALLSGPFPALNRTSQLTLLLLLGAALSYQIKIQATRALLGQQRHAAQVS